MNLIEAVKSGKAFRRKEWDTSCIASVIYNPNKGLLFNLWHGSYAHWVEKIELKDLLAEDYEVVDE